MAHLNALGAYLFTKAEDDGACEPCSGQTYCTPFQDKDRIAFQIPAECCGVVEGCEELTEACIEINDIELSDLAEQEGGCVTWPSAGYLSGFSRLIFMPYDFGTGTYRICFCIEGVELLEGLEFNITPYVKNDVLTQNLGLITGPGKYCYTLSGIGAFTEFGLAIVNPTLATAAFRLCCMTVCEVVTYTAELIDSEGEVVTGITSGTNDIGQEFGLQINAPGEIPYGCYSIKVTNNCNDDVYYSQCLKVTHDDCETLLIKYRNRNNAFGFSYSNPNYMNFIRVKGRLKDPTFPDDSEIPTLSDNTNKVINSRVQMLWQVSLNDLPCYIHAALAVARRHSEFSIDNVEFVCAEGDYAPNWRRSSQFAPVQFEAFDQSFNGLSTYCG